MQRATWKIFLACAIGAGLGSLVALEMHRYFWWVGLIVGGLTGYLSYEWRAVVRAISQAYRAARGRRLRPNYWQDVGGFFVLWTSMILWCCLVSVLITIPNGPWDRPNVLAFLDIVVVCVTLPTAVNMLLSLSEDLCGSGFSPSARETLYYFAPPVVLFWHIPRGLIWAVPRILRAIVMTLVGIVYVALSFARFCHDFVWQLFLRIHSEMRLLCGVDAMLGAAIGYFAGSALIGAAAGGFLGVLNYAVVTERWLKRRGHLPIRL